MTQVQLAAAIGVTSTSVHRWEAGTIIPDFEAAVSLWSLAIEHGSGTSKRFAEFLADRGHSIEPLLSAAQTRLANTLDSAIANLSLDEFHLVLAFVEMLKNNDDRTADQMLRVLLEPWRQRVLEKQRPTTTPDATKTQSKRQKKRQKKT